MTSKTSLSALARPSLIAAAVFAMTAGLAQAQSNVTLYGRADVGVQYTNKSARADDPLYEVANGGRYPSIWGLKGTEDLGGGLSAVFNLEAHFATDTGAGTGAAGSSGSGGFRRQANVGIKSEYGTVLLGRQYSPEIFANIGTEPRAFKEQFSGLYPYALMQAPAGNPVNDLGIFNGNAVTYSNNFGPIYIGAGVAAGEGTGRTYVIGANYTSSAFVVSASYQQIEQAPDLDGSKHTMGGVAVPFGPFTVKANVQYGELYSATGANVKTNEITFYGVGVDWAWNPTNTLNLTYYSGENKIVAGAGTGAKPKADTFIVSNDYAISKRTTLYVQAAYSDADAAPAGFQYLTISPLLINGGQRGDAKTTMFGAGISHNF